MKIKWGEFGFENGLFSVQTSSRNQAILNQFIWCAFFGVLLLLSCLQSKRMRDTDKSRRLRSQLASHRSNVSLTPNVHSQLPINASRTNLTPTAAQRTNETIINMEIEDTSSIDSSAHSDSEVSTPTAPCQEDLPPNYEVPPSYDECFQQET